MAITRSWETKVLDQAEPAAQGVRPARRGNLLWLAAASLLVAAGLALVYFAKTQNFGEVQQELDRGDLVDLNSIRAADPLVPFLLVFADPAERETAARKTFEYLEAHRPVPNVGALA